MSVMILSPITWAKANVAVLIGAVVFGLAYWILTFFGVFHFLGVNIAVSYALGRCAEVGYHATTGSTTTLGSSR